MIRRSPGRAAMACPHQDVAPAGNLSECATCGAAMRWDPHADEYVGVDGRYCPAASDATLTLPHEAPSGCAGRTPLPARAAAPDYGEQALCTLCGIGDDPTYPHTPIRRVRDGKPYVEYLCGGCVRAEYGDMTGDPDVEEW